MADFNTHGGFFAPQGYTKIEEGGSHEENPNGGVQIGVDPNGVPNLVEEDETIYKDYVYSDNIDASADVLDKHSIPSKYAGKKYSQIADAFVEEAEERPLDPISNSGLEKMLLRLADAQEEQKAIKEQKDLEDELSKLTPEELEQLETMLAEQEASEQVLEQQQEIPLMKNGGPINRFDFGGTVPDNLATIRYKLQNAIAPNFGGIGFTPSKLVMPTAPSVALKTIPSAASKSEVRSQSTSVAPRSAVQPQPSSDEDFPTWMRYAGLGQNVIAAIANLAQSPDKYSFPRLPARYPSVEAPNIRAVEFNPIDVNRGVNDVLAAGAGSVRAALNSGVGPGTGVLLTAIDNNITGNLGAARVQTTETNNAQKNQAIAQNNANAEALANFRYKQALAKAQAESQADQYNSMLGMREELLNKQAEQSWADAISAPFNALAQGMSGVGKENYILNQIRNNKSLMGYYALKNGASAYTPFAKGGILLHKIGK